MDGYEHRPRARPGSHGASGNAPKHRTTTRSHSTRRPGHRHRMGVSGSRLGSRGGRPGALYGRQLSRLERNIKVTTSPDTSPMASATHSGVSAVSPTRVQSRRRLIFAAIALTLSTLIGVLSAHALATGPSVSPRARLAVGSSSPAAPLTSEPPALVPIDGRSAAGLLASAVAEYDIETTSGRGQGGTHGQRETYAELAFSAPRGSVISVNVQAASITDAPNGTRFERQDDDKLGTDRWVAIRTDHARNLRVSVALVVPEGTPPALGRAQMTAIAADSRWDFMVPADAGSAAPIAFTELD